MITFYGAELIGKALGIPVRHRDHHLLPPGALRKPRPSGLGSSKAFALKAQKVLAFAVRIWYTVFGARFLLLQEVGSGRTFRR